MEDVEDIAYLSDAVRGLRVINALAADAAQLGDSITGFVPGIARDTAYPVDSIAVIAHFKESARDSAQFSDSISMARVASASEVAQLGDAISGRRGPVLALDAAYLADTITVLATVTASAADVARIADSANFVRLAFVSESASLVDSVTTIRGTRTAVADAAQLVDSVAGYVHALSFANDAARISSTITGRIRALAVANDTAVFVDAAMLPLLGVAWSASSDTLAMSRYTGYRFNSMAAIGGKVFAASDDGIYLVGAADDAGAAINASVTTGLSDVGDPQQKRVREVFLGYTGSAAVTVSGTPRGSEIEAGTYAIPVKTAEDATATRVKIGRGFKSRFVRFVISGAKFQLTEIRAAIDQLSRKI